MKFEIFDIAEMLALLTSIFCLKYIRKTPYIYFIPYLLMTVIAEQTGKYLGYINKPDLNIKLYNITTVVEFLFFYYLLYMANGKPAFKKIIAVFSIIYVICVVINQAFIQGFSFFHSYTVLLGTVFIIGFIFLYFYDAFENKEPVILVKEPMFWIAIGIFLFYLGDFTFNLMYPYLIEHNLKRERRLFSMINHNLIVLMYLFFTIALILWSRNRSALKQL